MNYDQSISTPDLLAGSPRVLSTAYTTTQQRIPSVLNPAVIMNPSPVFQSPIITNEIGFPNRPSISSCVNSTSTFEFSNPTTPSFAIRVPFVVGDAKSNTTTHFTSSATMLSSTNYTTATFTSTTSSTAEISFPKLESTTSVLSRVRTPVFSSSKHKSDAFRFRRPPTPPAIFSIPTSSSGTFARSTATDFNFTTNTATASRINNTSTAAFTFPNVTFNYSSNDANTIGGIGTHSADVFTYSNPTFTSTNATCTTGGLGSHSPNVFTFSSPTTVLFPSPSSTTIIFSTAGTPIFSVSNHKCSALTFQRPANPPVAFPTPTTSSFPSSRFAATVFNFAPATAYANRLRNPSTTAFTFSNPTFNSTITTSTAGRIGNQYPDAFTFSNPTTALFLFPTTSVPTFVTPYSHNTEYTDYAFGHPFNVPIFQYPRAVLRPSATMFSFEDQANATFTSPMPPTTGYGAPTFSTDGTPASTSSNTTHSFLNSGDTTSRELMLSASPISESRCCQVACWNPRSNESMFPQSTNLPECTICTEKERDIAFEPCGHLFVCSDCVKHIGILCPICRKVIKKKIKIYIS